MMAIITTAKTRMTFLPSILNLQQASGADLPLIGVMQAQASCSRLAAQRRPCVAAGPSWKRRNRQRHGQVAVGDRSSRQVGCACALLAGPHPTGDSAADETSCGPVILHFVETWTWSFVDKWPSLRFEQIVIGSKGQVGSNDAGQTRTTRIADVDAPGELDCLASSAPWSARASTTNEA